MKEQIRMYMLMTVKKSSLKRIPFIIGNYSHNSLMLKELLYNYTLSFHTVLLIFGIIPLTLHVVERTSYYLFTSCLVRF